MESIQAVIISIRYRNPEHTWLIATMKYVNKKETFTAVGDIPFADPEVEIMIYGEWVEDKKYGKQFKVTTSHRVLPTNLFDLTRYLASSEEIKGIGPVRAGKLASFFGSKLLNTLDDENVQCKLKECPGISNEMARTIASSWKQDSAIRRLSIFLCGHGISSHWARRILRQWDTGNAVESIQKNPYKLTEIDGIGFHTADEIASSLGYKKDSLERIVAACIYILQKTSSEGHVFLYEQQLIDEVVKLIVPRGKDETKVREQSSQAITESINNNQIKVEIISDNYSTIKLLYLPHLYKAEKYLSERITELNEYNHKTPIHLEEYVEAVQDKQHVKFSDKQLEAIRGAFSNHTMVITGGPGTGKTTCTRAIYEIAKRLSRKLYGVAPTGRAAKRLSEITGGDATTIHRLLGWGQDGPKFNRGNHIEADILIIDESSMLDLELGHCLFEAIPERCSVIFVGDANQLPAIGAGTVLRDIIKSNTIPTVTLETVFRQAEQSLIIRNAHLIRQGELPRFPETKGVDEDCYVMWMPTNKDKEVNGKDDDKWLKEKLCQLVTSNIINKCSKMNKPIDPIKDIQVLVPMKKGTIGSHELNKVLQEALNPNGKEFIAGGRVFRYGDRVMQTRNNYDKEMEVYNGDIGFIESHDPEEKSVSINFYGRRVIFNYEELLYITHAYAQTIHKAQGSEYPVVVIVMAYQHWPMLERNLFYTASTRAKQLCVFILAKGAVQQAIKNNPVHNRNSYLAYRLKELSNA